MRAVRFYDYGGPEVLRLEEVAVPKLSPGEVLLKVYASSIRRNDINMRAGQDGYFRAPAAVSIGSRVQWRRCGRSSWGCRLEGRRRSHHTEHYTVRHLRQLPQQPRGNVPVAKVSGRVLVGRLCELVTVPAASLIHKPRNLDHDQAACFREVR